MPYENIHDIYDRIAKRSLSLSATCTVNMINGLFGTNYPTNSEVTYNWTEHTDSELKRTLADTIVTINYQHSYHMEFQMTQDGNMIFRVLEYGFRHALQSKSGLDEIFFPEPLIIFLDEPQNFPDQYQIKINFGSQGSFLYTAPVFKYLEKSLEELDQRKLVPLIPFQLLRLRKDIEKERTPENMAALKKLVCHDIMKSLALNMQAGNITSIDATKLGRIIHFLYEHIYGKYEELKEEGVSQMAETALLFDIDILDYKLRKMEAENQKLEATNQDLQFKKQELEAEKQNLETVKQNLEAKNQDLQSVKLELEAEKQNLEAEKQDLQSVKLELEAEKQNLEAENQDLQSVKLELEAEKQNLEAEKQNLESENQNLQSANQNLLLKSKIWKLSSRQLSVDEISEKLQISSEFVLAVLTED